MRQAAVAGTQKRLARCFRVVQVASEWHKKLAKTLKCFISRKGAYHNNGYITDEDLHYNIDVFRADDTPLNPFRTAVTFWVQISQISNSLSPKRDCGSKGHAGTQVSPGSRVSGQSNL